ncbi:MAG: leucine-rich repeat domain-containing protein [Promethearchaeota archaeon]
MDEYIGLAESITRYNNIKLYESDANILETLEKIVCRKGEKILPFSSSSKEFGFGYSNNHLTELILREKENGTIIAPLKLPEGLEKLRHLYSLNIPLIEIPENIGVIQSLKKFDIHGGRASKIPESIHLLIGWITRLKLEGNPIFEVGEKASEFMAWWAEKLGLYKDILDKNDKVFIFLFQSALGEKEALPSVDKNSDEFGYTLENNKIIKLNLNDHGLSSFPGSIGALKNLETLKIYSNQLSSLPESIGRLTNLKELWIFNNKLSSLPESIGNLKNLIYLHLGGNQLSSLPESIGALKSLQKLDLESNKLSSLPESIGRLTNLQKLDLSYNELSSLPESIGALKNLEELDLSYNELSSLPESIGNLTNLEYLSIHDNQLSSLPERIKAQLRKLKNHGCRIYGIEL